jgi:glycosyltransferase involved in cell wall biosynthesis
MASLISLDGVANQPTGQTLKGTKPQIDTIWFDLSVRMLTMGWLSGITRTIAELGKYLGPNENRKIKYCVMLPSVGFVEVDTDWLNASGVSPVRAIQQRPAGPAEPDATPKKYVPPASRFWYLPWKLRNAFRARQASFWYEPPAPPAPPPPPAAIPANQTAPYPPEALRAPVQLGPRDLFLSFGGYWVVEHMDSAIQKLKQRDGFYCASLVYDLIPTLAPHLSDPRTVNLFTPTTRKQLAASDLVFTISEYSKQDILSFCAKELIPAPAVEVFYLGSDIPGRDPHGPAPVNTAPPTDSTPFVLTVGTVEARKNQLFLLYVWKKMLSTLGPEKTPRLVVAGKPGWLHEQPMYFIQNDPQLKDHVVLRSNPTDRDLDWLYRNCLFTVYPSVFEGWGLPVEESLSYGKLCVTTTASSLPEVGGPFADYVEPDDLDGLTTAIVKAFDPTYRARREQMIREKFEPHTWAGAAADIEKIIAKYFNVRPPAVPARKLTRWGWRNAA